MLVNKKYSYKKCGNTLKRFQVWGLLLVLIITVLSSGCASNNVNTGKTGSLPQQKKTIIATSFYPMYIMTLNIARDIPGIQVVNITRPNTGCLHDYQLTTEELKKLENTSFLVTNGAGMESFIGKVTSQYPDLRIINASYGIDLIKDEHGMDNPHIWVSVSLAIQQVKTIAGELAKYDKGNAALYQANADAYIKKLEDLKNLMHQSLDGVKQKDIITFHEAFPYFAQEFKLNVVAVIEREPGSEPSAGELAQTITLLRQAGIKTVFAEPQYPAKAADTIARETGAHISYLDPAVSGPDDPDAYIKTMQKNLTALKKALGGSNE